MNLLPPPTQGFCWFPFRLCYIIIKPTSKSINFTPEKKHKQEKQTCFLTGCQSCSRSHNVKHPKLQETNFQYFDQDVLYLLLIRIFNNSHIFDKNRHTLQPISVHVYGPHLCCTSTGKWQHHIALGFNMTSETQYTFKCILHQHSTCVVADISLLQT